MYDLLHPDWTTVVLAMVVMLAFSVAFGLLAMRHFLKRDL
jgi:ABC-type antimicrobial peptide transport system permease subunit